MRACCPVRIVTSPPVGHAQALRRKKAKTTLLQFAKSAAPSSLRSRRLSAHEPLLLQPVPAYDPLGGSADAEAASQLVYVAVDLTSAGSAKSSSSRMATPPASSAGRCRPMPPLSPSSIRSSSTVARLSTIPDDARVAQPALRASALYEPGCVVPRHRRGADNLDRRASPVQLDTDLAMDRRPRQSWWNELRRRPRTSTRWPSGFACPACGCAQSSSFRREGRLYIQRTACRHQWSLVSGTIFG